MKPGLSRLIAIMLFIAAGAATAADVGRVLLAAGDTVAVRDQRIIRLVFGSTVQDKDVLRTGPASHLQVRFIDESILSMRENSEVRIDEFRFTGKEDGTERAFFSLLKGALRKVTGIIGRTHHNNYRMGSIVATIGVRGTDYAATFCQRDCRNPDGTLAKDGLYGRVIGASFGTTRLAVTNKTPERIFGITQNFYVADINTPPVPILEPPGFLYTRVQGRPTTKPGGTGKEQVAQGGATQEGRTTNEPPPVVLPRLLTADGGIAGPALSDTPIPPSAAAAPTIGAVAAYVDALGQAGYGGAYVTSSMLTFNASGFVSGFNIPAGTTEVDGSGIDPPGVIGTATSVVDTGSADPGDGSVDARWGRWGSTLTDDTGTSILPGGLHGMVGNLTPPEVVAAKSGTFDFFTFGGTTPTNNSGETAGSFGYPSPIIINFTTRQASLGSFFWGFPSNSWTFPAGSANVIITPGKGAGIEGLYSGGSCSGYNCSGPITLGVTGIFYGPRGDHLGAAFAGESGSARAMGVKLYTCSPSC